MQQNATKKNEMVVPITLSDYWHETISRKEALRRLEGRDIEPKTRAKIIKDIPEQTEHFLTFDDGAFREYAFSGQGTAALLLLLPVHRQGNSFLVFVPIHHSDRFPSGADRHFTGIDAHIFKGASGKLFENGVHRPTFRYSTKPVTLPLDVSFAVPIQKRHKTNFSCCGACEWVHSALDIHCADPICCLGTCGPGHPHRMLT